MIGFLREMLWGDGFMPHGHCFMWDAGLLRLHVVSDALIALSYISIPFSLWHFVRKRKDLPFSWVFICFAVFIISCGATHILEIWTLWVPSYWISGIVKAITACASVGTAVLLVRLMPLALALPTPTQLQIANEKFRGMLEAVPDATIVVGDKGEILLVNGHAETLFGYPRVELVGKPVELLVPARFRGQHSEQRQGYSHAPKPRPMGAAVDLWALRKDGSEFPAEISLSPVKTSEGTLTISAIRDVTDRKKVEGVLRQTAAELERSNRDLEAFAYAASHDLQEPLRNVANYCELLGVRYKGRLGADADDYIHFAVDGARRMRALIEGLLNYSRVGAKGAAFRQVSMESALTQALDNLSRGISETKATIIRKPLPAVRGDELQLTLLLQNLIGNALKFKSAAPPVVTISAEREAASWRFSIADNGIGIEPQYVDKLFTIFQRLHSRKEYPGTGIGLALCKKIVERHGGRIGAESRSGEGSTFWFSLSAEDENC